MKKLCAVILNYRGAQLTIDCVSSLAGQIRGHQDRYAVVVDNDSRDGSASEIERFIDKNAWSDWVQLVSSSRNGGFAAGNNIGLKAVDAELYLLMNSDTRLTDNAIDALLKSEKEHPRAGIIGPQLQGPNGEPQISCFRYRTPISEMMRAAGTGPIDRTLGRWNVAIDVPAEAMRPPWISFACVLIRREVIECIGYLDDGFFMYFEDIDYCRRAWNSGWHVLYDPVPKVVHLRGGSSSVKSAIKNRTRIPRYYYESRSRYFAKHYGSVPGLVFTNAMWVLGRVVSRAREMVQNKEPHLCEYEMRDNWTNWRDPMRPPTTISGSNP